MIILATDWMLVTQALVGVFIISTVVLLAFSKV